MRNASRRAGIIGASGIGRFHAAWYKHLGCSIEAFAGSSPESVARTKKVLRDLLGLECAGYHRLDEMFANHHLDAVSICSPRNLHFEHATAALEAGANVLCEKPLAWFDDKPFAEALEAASQLVNHARKAKLVLGLNTQYAALWDEYARIYRSARGSVNPIEEFYFYMETCRHNRAPLHYHDIWIELAPHPIAVLQRCIPKVVLNLSSIKSEVKTNEFTTSFECMARGSQCCRANIVLRTVERHTPRRVFGVNGFVIAVEQQSESLAHQMHLRSSEGEVSCEDLMLSSIRKFVLASSGTGQALVDGDTAVTNLSVQQAVLDASTIHGQRLTERRRM